MSLPDLRTITTAGLVVTNRVTEFPALLAAQSKDMTGSQHVLLVHNQERLSISIDLIRDIQVAAQYSLGNTEYREIVFLWADLLTIPAQQALLKLLEEPPQRTRLWLVTDNPRNLLETIQSRCLLCIDPTPVQNDTDQLPGTLPVPELEDFTTASFSKVMTLAALPKDRSQAASWCRRLLSHYRPDQTALSRLAQHHLLLALEQLQQNGQTKLVLEACFFAIKKGT